MESTPVQCLHNSCGVSEIKQASIAKESDFWYKTVSVLTLYKALSIWYCVYYIHNEIVV